VSRSSLLDVAPPSRVGRYSLFGAIASGGMATVYLGRVEGAVGFSKMVAVKRLHAQFSKNAELVTMFLDEARLAARIHHPNVVQTFDVVAEGAGTQDSEVFLVLEYVHGETLARVLRALEKQRGRIEPKIAVTLAANILHGLHAAHEATDEQGRPLCIVHRDVSPQNVIVGVDGVGRVLDFGIAKAVGRMQTTREGQLKGKIAYMAPEQIAGEEVDRRTDVYAASIVLWESLVGRRLFDADNEGALISQIARGAKSPPSAHVEGIPPELDAIVMRGLSTTPARRFASARDMAVALEDAIGIASPRQVGEWLWGVVGEALESRADQVKAIERGQDSERVSLPRVEPVSGAEPQKRASSSEPSEPSPGSVTSTQVAPPAEPSLPEAPVEPPKEAARDVTQLTASNANAERPAPASRRVYAAVIGAVVIALIAWRIGAGSSSGGAAAASMSSSSARDGASSDSAPVLQNATSPSGTVTTTGAASGSLIESPRVEPSSAASAVVTPASSERVEAKAPPRGPANARPVSAASAKAAPPDCDPPYTVDATGLRKIKPQCL
jgi:serine/threonine-protein kinase